MNIEQARTLRHEKYSDDYRELVFSSPAIASSVVPGQFIHLLVPGLGHAALRRPFSIFKADSESITILYKSVGKGTSEMRNIHVSDEVSLVGPLGNGFPMDLAGRSPVCVAGGYGVAPLLFLANCLSTTGTVFIGGASKSDILCKEQFEEIGWETKVTTEDGSLGEKGLVTDLFDSWLAADEEQTPELYACGPDGMLKAVSDRAIDRGLTAWLSLDKHMGCGVGACLACVQKIRSDDGTEAWARVCRDGPVFEARQIVW